MYVAMPKFGEQKVFYLDFEWEYSNIYYYIVLYIFCTYFLIPISFTYKLFSAYIFYQFLLYIPFKVRFIGTINKNMGEKIKIHVIL